MKERGREKVLIKGGDRMKRDRGREVGGEHRVSETSLASEERATLLTWHAEWNVG